MNRLIILCLFVFCGTIISFCSKASNAQPVNERIRYENIEQKIDSLDARLSSIEKQKQSNSDFLLKLSSLVLSIFAFSISLFHICMTWRKPKLVMNYKDEFLSNYQSLSVKIKNRDLVPKISIYIRISNKRNVVAKDCNGKLLCCFVDDKLRKNIFPHNLLWKSGPQYIDLSKGEYDYLGIFEGINEDSYMKIQTSQETDVKIDKSKSYVFKIGVYSKNANPIYSWYRLEPDYKFTEMKRAESVRYEKEIKVL